MRVLVLLVAIAGCGRLGFDGSAGDARGDGVSGDGDAQTLCSQLFDLCDGFEAGAIDTAVWTPDPLVTRDTTRAHRGGASIHVHMPAFAANTNNYATLDETKTIASGATTFWVRGWFWLSALPAGANGMELISAERPGFAGDYVFVFSASTRLYSQFDGSSQMSSTTLPVGSWFCVLWKVVRSTTTTGSLELAGDAPPLALANVQTDATQAMTVLRLGMGFAASNTPAAQPALDLWLDDVIVHSAPPTCAD